MKLFGIVLIVLTATGAARPNHRATFDATSYEAIVDSDDVHARCGPGSKYYPTDRLLRGDRVVVHRHDPGGWYMIAPPPQSFSWIRAEYVKKIGRNSGVVTIPDHERGGVAIRVGSSVSERRDVWQRRLSNGEHVTLLGEATVQIEAGPVRMYKIKPPQGEFRWVEGKYLTRLDAVARQRQGHDRFRRGPQGNDWSSGSRRKRYEEPGSKFDGFSDAIDPNSQGGNDSENDLVERPLHRSRKGQAVRRSGAEEDELDADRHRLQLIDGRFRAMLREDASQWEFGDLENDYREFQKTVSHPAFVSQIELRFAALDRYKSIKAEYDDFLRLKAETDHRESELLALERQQLKVISNGRQTRRRAPASPQPPPSGGTRHPVPPPAALPPRDSLPITSPPQRTVPLPRQAAPQRPASAPPPVPATPSVPETSSQMRRDHSSGFQQAAPPVQRTPAHGRPRQFDGAGFVQRAAVRHPGGPRYVLLDARGRILAFLQAEPGVNLDGYVGRSVGVYGKRSRRGDLQLDVIRVRQLVPVQM